ncbi:MAG: nitrate reductase subunit beta [Planctomycetes bacterium]|nr:nitrate reductase subunit beta [Planctomycetota bacterium]
MDVRAQVTTVFHLDKCIGCHTCSIACKNIWTDREGTEYMWWNNVETKPGTGYPTKWEDQSKYNGGWERTKNGKLRLKSTSKKSIPFNIFHNPNLPTLDDYYEPWTYKYEDLFNAPEQSSQVTAMPKSLITGEIIEHIKSGPNWDDDLSGSPIYAENDPNLSAVSDDIRKQMFAVERLAFFYFPRICNHCLNPACVASCPSGALYKRGEDGIVLLNQERCRAWRSCISACPYKKTYYNWSTGKSEKCILCFPRIESGQAPACMHSCVGRIRYIGMTLYDADRIVEVANLDDNQLAEGMRSLILDPRDPEVIEAAQRNGVHDSVIEAAQNSPSYKFIKTWKLALPPHPEFRTLPMLWYVPPLSPVLASLDTGKVSNSTDELFESVEKFRMPISYLANLLSGGNEGLIRYSLKKMLAVRMLQRHKTVGDIERGTVDKMLKEADTTEREATEIYRLTSLATFDERFSIPPAHREEAIESVGVVQEHKASAGFGFKFAPRRGL